MKMNLKKKDDEDSDTVGQISPSDIRAPKVAGCIYDVNLLTQSKIQWLLGDWGNLGVLKVDDLQCHPDRAEIALFAASARFQVGQTAEARYFIVLARKWGASNIVIARLFAADVHRSLSRVAAVLGRDVLAYQHIKNAIKAKGGCFAVTCSVDACYRSEFLSLGLLDNCEGRLQILQSKQTKIANSTKILIPLKAQSRAHSLYRTLGKNGEKPAPFLLIDAKSLPRSGIHYLKSSMTKLFKDDFSFCEWYTEPGCCRQMPCVLTGFAKLAQETGKMKIRITKSHDFDLSDPMFQTAQHLRRLVLIRDPLFILTSWFTLSLLFWHGDILKKEGIQPQKINFSHEKGVMLQAYTLVSNNMTRPSVQKVSEWLEKQKIYINSFINKWVLQNSECQDPFADIVFYERIDEYIKKIYAETCSFIPKKEPYDLCNIKDSFVKRENPFQGPTDIISALLYEFSPLFKDIADDLKTHHIFRGGL